MTNSLTARLDARLGLLPTCADYRELLDLSHARTGVNYDTLRDVTGSYTYAQWAQFLDIYVYANFKHQ